MKEIAFLGFCSGVCFANLGWMIPTYAAQGGATATFSVIALTVGGLIFATFATIGVMAETEAANAARAPHKPTPEANRG